MIRFILQKAFSRHFDVPVTCEALELLFGTSFQQLESLATHTQKLGAQLAPPAFQGLRLACCVADMHDSRLMIFSVLLVIRITKTDGVPCGENIELVQTRTPCILLSQEIVPQISDLNSNRSRSFIRASVHHSANRQTEVVVVKSFFLCLAVAQDGGGGGGGNFF